MVEIRECDLIDSVSDALQHISYYHPTDYVRALGDAYEREESPAAKDAIAQILTNSRMSAIGHRPICQDTGIVTIFVKWGQECSLVSDRSLQSIIDEGVRRAYSDSANPLRASIVSDPAFTRRNTRDNTPSVVHVELVPGRQVQVTLAAKGGGSENKAKFKMLIPSESIVDWVLDVVPTMGAGWCPPGMLGPGVGGTAEKAMLLAKESLMAPIEGTATRILLELHRAELVEMRNDQLEKVMAIYAHILDATLPLAVRKALYQDLIQREAGPKAPYTAMTKCLVASMERALDPAVLAA